MQQQSNRGAAAAATTVSRQQYLPGEAAAAATFDRVQQQPRAEAAAILTPHVNTRNSPQSQEPSFSIVTTSAQIHAPPSQQARYRYKGAISSQENTAVGGTRVMSVQLP